MGNLRLLITMPVSKGAYVLGSLAYSSISGTITVVALLGFGWRRVWKSTLLGDWHHASS